MKRFHLLFAYFDNQPTCPVPDLHSVAVNNNIADPAAVILDR